MEVKWEKFSLRMPSNKYGRNHGYRKPQFEYHINNFCRQDPLMDDEISGKNVKEEKIIFSVPEILKNLLIMLMVLTNIQKFFNNPSS